MKNIFKKKEDTANEMDPIDALEEKVARLERIMKYAGDKPSFKLYRSSEQISSDWSVLRRPEQKVRLRLYIDREEYDIRVPELDYTYVNNFDGKITVKDNIATLVFLECTGLRITQHTFNIDYTKGSYIHSEETVWTPSPFTKSEEESKTGSEPQPDDKELVIWQQRCERMRDFMKKHVSYSDLLIKNAYCAGQFTANDLKFFGVELPEIMEEDEEEN